VWREVCALELVIVGWNAYPFHPHRPGEPRSNRTPRAAEVRQGQPFLAHVCALFAGAPVVAMGNTAARALMLLSVEHIKVRHPAQGGARLFAAGLRQVVEGLK
jgi:uracil-DNA glycosylase